MVVQDRDAVTYFFKGLPEGAAIPWSAWVVPLVASIHYIGFAVSATNMTSASWFSIFLGSVLKAFILKYGGVRLYRALRPLFLGFILGQITCSAFWLVVDLLAGGTGNKVPVFSQHY